jgi:hypothetical protein
VAGQEHERLAIDRYTFNIRTIVGGRIKIHHVVPTTILEEA